MMTCIIIFTNNYIFSTLDDNKVIFQEEMMQALKEAKRKDGIKGRRGSKNKFIDIMGGIKGGLEGLFG